MRVGDVYADGSVVTEGSSSVTINGRPAARRFDANSSGSHALTGSYNVFIGDEGIPYSRPEVSASPCQDAQKKVLEEVE